MDPDTELTSLTGLQGVIVYNVRLINQQAANLDADALGASVRPGLTKAACTTPEIRDGFLKDGVTVRYSYRDKDGQSLFAVDVSRGDCAS